jgi:hypothetical protein
VKILNGKTAFDHFLFLASGGKYGSNPSSLPSIGVGFNSVSGLLVWCGQAFGYFGWIPDRSIRE